LEHLKRLRQYRDLLAAMTLRDLQVRYKQTFMGAAWAVAQPLSFMLILTGLKSGIFKEPSSEGMPHELFLYCALVPWMFFQSSLTFASNSISGNMNLIKKTYFPREIFPMASILACVVDFLIASGIFAGMMVFYYIPFSMSLVWIPALFVVELLFVLGVGMFVAATNVFYRDVKYIVPLALQMLLFASPVIYSVSRVPEDLRSWYLLNPMAVVIDGFRKVILHGVAPDLQWLAVSFGVAALCCILAYRFFKRLEVKFADLI
ncbi:MAG: ABC transporter permease, partial [Candidatus Binatia bacterium]